MKPCKKFLKMALNFFLMLLSFPGIENADISRSSCEQFPLHNASDFYVTCEGNFIELGSLKKHLQNITYITVFELQDAVLEVLPPDVFHDVQKPLIRKIIFNNVTMDLLGVPELGPPPFKTIKDTVETFEMYNSSGVFAWDFASQSFENLKSIIIEDSELISVASPFSFWPHLRFVQLRNCSIKWIHREVFKKNKDLTICSLAHNKIHMILRSMFPRPAERLYSLDLSFNRLQWLPENLFLNMDMLREVKLDYNKIVKLSEELLAPVWNNLVQLWVDGNKIRCDSMCWMTGTTDKPKFLESSKCESYNMRMFIEVFFEQCASKTKSS